MTVSLDLDELTPDQRRVWPYYKSRNSTMFIARRLGLTSARVCQVRSELRTIEKRGGKLTPGELTARAAEKERELGAADRCGVCHLLEPHVCIERRAIREASRWNG